MRLLVFLCLLLFPASAHAEWLEASGARFVVYANDSEQNIRRLSEQLERYDAALASLTVVHRNPPSRSNRITVYVVKNIDEVQRLVGGDAQNVAGFTIARAGNSMAVIPHAGSLVSVTRESNGLHPLQSETDLSMMVLLHEYAHYFIRSMGGFPEPRWLSEGEAEFYSTARFGSDGSVELGEPAEHRIQELMAANDVTVEDLLDPDRYEQRRRGSDDYDAFYGMSWLFYHYLAFNKARAGQIHRYGELLAQGKSLPEAGLEAFGDLKQLERELDHYLIWTTKPTVTLPAAKVPIGPIVIRRLTAGEAAIMPVRIRSQRGVDPAQAVKLLPQARTIAARFPQDAAVLSELAQAEYDAGNDKEAIAAADAALAIDQSQADAYVQKGEALLRIAEKADDKIAAFDAARAPFLALSQREPDNPLPMINLYQSYVLQKIDPPTDAVAGLQRAVGLAPFDMSLRMTLAMQQLRNRQRGPARINLLPVAYDPHGGPLADQAKQTLARIDRDSGPGGRRGGGLRPVRNDLDSGEH